MGVVVQIREARQLDEGIWKVRLSSSEIRFLDPKAENAGSFTILLLTENPAFDGETGLLSFDPSSAKLLNVGTSDTAIVIGKINLGRRQAAAVGVASGRVAVTSLGMGDRRFLESLPSHLKDLGTELLRRVRAIARGDLRFYPSSGKYVETPDNFWAIRPQPRDQSFRV